MDNFQLTSLLSKVRQFESEQDPSDLVGIFFIKVNDWDVRNFRPVVYLMKEKLVLWISEKYIEIKKESVKELMFDNKRNTISINFGGDKLTFSLVDMDKLLLKTNQAYTKTFHKVLNQWIDNKPISNELLMELPNQIAAFSSNINSIVIIASSILLITFGVILQPFNFTLAWFFLLGGLIIGVGGIIITLIKKRG